MTHRPLTALWVAPRTVLAVLACDGDDPAGPDVPGPPASLTLSADTLRFAALEAIVRDGNGNIIPDAAVV